MSPCKIAGDEQSVEDLTIDDLLRQCVEARRVGLAP
jgi:hypothetical protein